MNVNLTPELEQFIRAQVDRGRYKSVSEVVRAALSLLVTREDWGEETPGYLERSPQRLERLRRVSS